MSFFKTLLAVFLPLLIGAGLIYGIAKYKPEYLGLSKGETNLQTEADNVANVVGKLMTLPTGERPTVATVTDLEKIKEQNFFKNSEVGDKVLIYTNAKKVILYRPSENKIIDVGVVSINEPIKPVVSPLPTEEATASATPIVATKQTPTASSSASPKSTPVLVY